MEKIFKNVNLLYIVYNDSILMRKSMHQGYEIIDVFAFKDNNNIDASITEKLTSLFGKIFPYHYYGTIESVINKEGITVSIAIKAYKVLLDEKQNVLDGYADDITKCGNDIVWIHKNDIKNEIRLREGDKKVLERVFEDRIFNIKMVEDQGERWIDAKMIVFEDR